MLARELINGFSNRFSNTRWLGCTGLAGLAALGELLDLWGFTSSLLSGWILIFKWAILADIGGVTSNMVLNLFLEFLNGSTNHLTTSSVQILF